MPTLEERLQFLAGGPAESTAAIVSIALQRAAPAELGPLCRTLVATGVSDGVARTMAYVSKLDDAAQGEVAQALALSEPVLRAVMHAGVHATATLVELLRRRQPHDTPSVLARLVATAPWQEVRDAAAEALLQAIERSLGPTANPVALPVAQAKRLDEALSEAVDRYREHRCDAVLNVLALLSRSPGPKLAAILSDSGHPAMFALRHVVARSERAELRQQLIRLLTSASLSHVIQRNLHRAAEGVRVEDVLCGAHLLRAPLRRKAMRAVDRPLRCLPSMADGLRMSRAGQANLPLLVESLGVPTSRRLEHLADCVALESELGRLRAAMSLARYDAEDARCALKPFAFDRSPWVARIAGHAAMAGAHRSSTATAASTALVSAAEVNIARRARWCASLGGAASFFEHWHHLPAYEQAASARIALTHDRLAFIESMSETLNAGERSERLAGLWLTQRLQLVGELEQECVVLAGVGDAHVASAAVTALGSFRSERTEQAVRVALRHPDARVRANAVEAMARHDSVGMIETVAPLMEHKHNRLRGNSVRALLRHQLPAGAQALRSMLGDADPMHRISGLWVASRCMATFARDQLRMLMERDDRMEIRRRAAYTLQRLERTPRRAAQSEAIVA